MTGILSAARAVGTVLVVLAVSGCFWKGNRAEDCTRAEPYQQARSIPNVKIPDDLDKPDRQGALVIPDPSPVAAERLREAPCLKQPPDYFDHPLVDEAT